MALTASTLWEVESAVSSETNAGGAFDPSQTAGMFTDGAATSATGTAPVFTSASYNFVAGDAGSWIYISSGTNWTAGWYKISSVASNAATLDATAGHATLKPEAVYDAEYNLSTVDGCATTASPTAATWTIDYSQQATNQFTYTDLASAGAGLTVSSAAFPFGKQQVGNSIVITGGTNFTNGRYVIASVAAGVATVIGPGNITTGVGASGTGGQGGALKALATVTGITIDGNILWSKGTFTLTATLSLATSSYFDFRGYGTYRGDTSKATITTATNSTKLINMNDGTLVFFRNTTLSNTAGTRADGLYVGGGQLTHSLFMKDSVIDGFAIGINTITGTGNCYKLQLINTEIKNCTSHGAFIAGFRSVNIFFGCKVHANGGDGIRFDSTGFGNQSSSAIFISTAVYSNTGAGVFNRQEDTLPSSVAMHFDGCALVNNTGDNITTVGGGTHYGQSIGLMNSVIELSGAYGINVPAAPVKLPVYYGHSNAFYSNTSGARNNFPTLPGDVTLTGDPFTSYSTGDFTLNSTAGAGAACKAAGFQSTILG